MKDKGVTLADIMQTIAVAPVVERDEEGERQPEPA